MSGNIVIVGAGGTGLSSIAMLLHELGFNNLICIDKNTSQITEKLETLGIKVIIGHGKYAVQREDFVIYSDIEAIKQGPEIQASLSYQATQTPKTPHRPYSYNEFVAELSKCFRTVCIAGSNGKSSSTGLSLFAAKKLMPSLGLGILGAFLPDFGHKNYVLNTDHTQDIKQIFSYIFSAKAANGFDYTLLKKYYFFLESCEFKEHFLLYDADRTIITNIDHDHTDYFITYDSYKQAFHKLINRTRNSVIMSEQAANELGYTTQENEQESDTNIIITPNTKSSQSFSPITFTKIFGEHHQWNAQQSLALLSKIEEDSPGTIVSESERKQSYQDFSGLGRRMELLHTFANNARLYSDYSHHAPAIATNFSALQQQFPEHTLVAIFQPHQARRVVHGWFDFASSLQNFDETYIYQLFTARESVQDFDFSAITEESVTSFEQLGNLFAQQCNGTYLSDFEAIEKIYNNPQANTIYILFTAGNLDFATRKRLEKQS